MLFPNPSDLALVELYAANGKRTVKIFKSLALARNSLSNFLYGKHGASGSIYRLIDGDWELEVSRGATSAKA